MRPIIGLAAWGLVVSASPAPAATDEAPVAPAWLSIQPRPIRLRMMIDHLPREVVGARVQLLGPAPDSDPMIRFSHGAAGAPSGASLLRDAPRLSRLSGKHVDNFAAGWSAALAGDALTVEGGVFCDKYRNLQTTVRQGMTLVTANVGKAKLFGIEGSARWTPGGPLSLFATLSHGEGRLKNLVRDGHKLRLSADQSASIGAILLMPAGAGRFAFTPSLSRQSAIGFGVDDGGRGATTLVNAQFGYLFSENLEIEAVASNILDSQYSDQAAKPDRPALIAGEPRVLGLRARLRFGGV